MATPTHTIKRGDTGPAIEATLKGRDGAAQDLTGATVKLNLKKGSTVIVDHGDCDVVGTATDGNVSFAFPDTSSWDTGDYNAEFEVTLSGGEIVSFPNTGNFRVRVAEQVA